MGTPPVDTRKKQEAIRLYRELKSSALVGERMGVAGLTVRRWLDSEGIDRTGSKKTGKAWREARKIEEPAPEFILPDFPADDIPVDQIIDLQCKRFETRKASYDAHTWFPVKMKTDVPIGILFVGDAHIDDNGCDWPSLRAHSEISKRTEGLYAVNIGDTTNCWGGRLIRKYADQDSSLKTARRMVEWLLLDSGFRWLVWLFGNHEQMGDGSEIIVQMSKRHGTHRLVMHDWEARFVLRFPGGAEFRVNCAHDFPGNSMWNPLHGPVKAVKFGDRIDLAVCGHKHNWAVSHWEMPEGGVSPLMIRTRGYKFLDDFCRRLGIHEQNDGQSILVVFDPSAKVRSGQMMPFVDIEKGAEYLTWLRGKRG